MHSRPITRCASFWPIVPILTLCSGQVLAQASGPTAQPILQIETGMHTAPINGIGTDARNRYVVTASDDKTVRLWDANSGSLLKILYPPVGKDDEGKIDAVAISPDGQTIACSGNTGYEWDGSESIYLFDRATGELQQRLTGLPAIVNHLVYSPDGRLLAATMESGGIRLFSMDTDAPAASDGDYSGACHGAAFGPTPEGLRLVVACSDDFLRLYDVDKSTGALQIRIKHVSPAGGNSPYGVAFSPDGRKIAVGFSDSANVTVVSSDDLSNLFTPNTSGLTGTSGCVCWSNWGDFLWAGGTYAASDKVVIRKWSDGGQGQPYDVEVGSGTISDIATRRAGGIFFATFNPAWGSVDSQAKPTIIGSPASADFRNDPENFLISPDGSAVAFGYLKYTKPAAVFSLAKRELTPGGDTSMLSPPVTKADGLDIENWNGHDHPTLNGRPLSLTANEYSYSLAISPDQAHSNFLLGTQWYLRLFDRNGAPSWPKPVPTPGIAWALNISSDGRLAVAAFGDGTIRWYSMADGRELLDCFPQTTDQVHWHWVAWTPSGYYDCSTGGEDLIGWHLNNGASSAADFFPASRFRDTFYRPDVVLRVLKALDEGQALALANAASGRTPAPATSSTSVVAADEPPVLSILSPQAGDTFESGTVTVHYELRTPNGAPATDVVAQVDGRPAGEDSGLSIVSTSGVQRTITATVPDHDCTLSVLAYNQHGAGVPASIAIHWAGGQKGTQLENGQGAAQPGFVIKPILYVLAIGISKYGDPSLRLNYSAKDAQNFVKAMMRQKGHLYQDIILYKGGPLTDGNATRDNIEDGLEWLQRQTTAHDVAMIFLSGHGDNDQDGKYFFVPADFDRDHIKKTALYWTDLESTIHDTPGKMIVFDDSCHSGNALGGATRGLQDDNAAVNELASAENGAVVFAAATGSEYALENSAWGDGGDGAFTAALVEGLSGSATFGDSPEITLDMLEVYIENRVKQLTQGEQHPTEQKPLTVRDFPVAVKI